MIKISNRKKAMSNGRRGFTLIELLVVIAIIGILSSVVLASLGSARSKGRDARRMSDLKQMGDLVALQGESTAFAGCVAGAVAASACTTPDFSKFTDPSSTTLCATGATTAACNYRVSGKNQQANPTVNDWQVCGYLESGSGTLAAGPVHIGSDTNYSVMAGGCAF